MLVKNILLVYPVTPDSYWKFRGVFPFLGIKSAHGNLALATLAALWPSDRTVRLVDMNIVELTDVDLAWADVVAVTGMTEHRRGIAEVVARCRGAEKKVIVGGPFASAVPDASELKDASAVFIGEAVDRQVFGQLVADLDAGTLQSQYRASFSPPIADSPIPRFDLLDFSQVADAAIQVACGCPYRCEFCEVWKLFGAPRCKAPDQVVAELQALYDAGFRGSVFIVDDNYIGNIKAAWAITKAVHAWQQAHGFPFGFYTQTDIRLAEQEALAQLMVEAGFYACFVGLESPSAATLTSMGKKHNVGIDAAAAVKKLRNYGLLVYCGLIIGNDDDDANSFGQMERFAEVVGASRAMLGLCVATPGTNLYERLAQEGRLFPEVTGNQFAITNIRPKHMTLSALVTGHRQLLAAIYHPTKYFARARQELKEWRLVHRQLPKAREYRAAVLSIIKQGIFAPYRREYWQFLLDVFNDDPRKIGRAFAIAIVYAHFYDYTETLQQELGSVLERIVKLEETDAFKPAAAAS